MSMTTSTRLISFIQQERELKRQCENVGWSREKQKKRKGEEDRGRESSWILEINQSSFC